MSVNLQPTPTLINEVPPTPQEIADSWKQLHENKKIWVDRLTNKECMIKDKIQDTLIRENVNDEIFNSFLINFIPQEEFILQFCKERDSFSHCIIYNINEIIRLYKIFSENTNIDNYNNLLKNINKYFVCIFSEKKN